MSSLMDKLKKNSTIKEASILNDSKMMLEKDVITTPIPALNIALSGTLDGGLTPGLTVFAGKSKHFKSLFSLILAESYLRKYEDAVLMFYDNEFGSPIAYFESVGIDTSRVFHIPVSNIEELKHDVSKQLDEIDRNDKVIILIDSIGNIASIKEVDDAIEGKSVADMTRAKQLKSFFRIVTPKLTILDIPMVVVGHTYDTQEMYSKAVVSGGTGVYYSGDNIYIIGRQQEKEGSGQDAKNVGYKFIINVEKSRFTKEKSKIPVIVKYEGGISKYSGLLDIALELGFVTKPKKGWYAKVNVETGEISEKLYRFSQTDNALFWDEILESQIFKDAVYKAFRATAGALINNEIQSELEADTELDEDSEV